MPNFSYKGRNGRGELVQGVLEGADAGNVAELLFNNGITPLEIAAARGPARKTGESWLDRLFEQKVGVMDVLLFSRHMYTLMKAGVPIMRSLAGLEESTQNKAFARVMAGLRESLDAGRELSASLRRFPEVFSPFYVSMIRVGEMTGRLEEIFLRLFNHLEFDKHTREQVKAALRYPTFVILAMAVALVIINLFVIPAFAKVYSSFHAELPTLTKVLIGFSNFTMHYWPLLLVMVAAMVFGFRIYIRTAKGKYQWDRFKLRIPIVGSIVEKATLARFARSLALASQSGVPIVQALSVVSQVVDNDFIAQRILQMRDGVERGESILRTAVTAGVFTPVVLQMIAVGEETGSIDELMQEIADMYDREVEYQIKNLSAQIEPVLVIGIGIMVLVLALGVFLPIWDLGRVALHR